MFREIWRCYCVMTSPGGHLVRPRLIDVGFIGGDESSERNPQLKGMKFCRQFVYYLRCVWGWGVEEWRESISGSLYCKLQVSLRIVTDTKCGQLKPTSATLSRTMMDNTCLPGEPRSLELSVALRYNLGTLCQKSWIQSFRFKIALHV